MRPLTTATALGLLAALAAAPDPSAAAQNPPKNPAQLVAGVKPSVVRLRSFSAGKLQSTATGFVVEVGGVKKIVTSAHALKGAVTVTYKLPDMDDWAACSQAEYSMEYDLAFLSTHRAIPAPALPFDPKPRPQVGGIVHMFSSPGDLPLMYTRGYVGSDPVKVAALKKERVEFKPEEFGVMADELVLMPLGLMSSPGRSGAPGVNDQGEVFAVQMGTLTGTSDISFGVSSQYFAVPPPKLKLVKFGQAAPVPVDAGTLIVRHNNPATPGLNRPAGKKDDARLEHYGYLGKSAKNPADRNARTVIDRFIQDKERFRALFTEKRLQEDVLDKTDLAHLCLPALQVRMLVPKGYTYSVTPFQDPRGVVICFRHPDAAKLSPPYDEPLTIVVAYWPERFHESRAEYLKRFKTKLENIRVGKQNDPTDGKKMGEWVTSAVHDKFIKEYVLDVLNLRIKFPDGTYEGKPTNPVFTTRPFFAQDQTDHWLRWNFRAEKGNRIHAVHTGNLDPVAVINEFTVTAEDSAAFTGKGGGREPHQVFLDYLLIAASVSMY